MSKTDDLFDIADLFGEEDSVSEADILDDEFLDEDFLKEFESELAKLEASEDSEEVNPEELKQSEVDNETDVLSLFGNLESILNGPEEQEEPVTETEPVVETEEVALAEDVAEVESEPEVPGVEEGFSFANLFADSESTTADITPEEDPDVLKILEGLEGIDLELDEEDQGNVSGEAQNFSALEGFLAASAAAPPLENTVSTENTESEDLNLSALGFGENKTESGDSEEKETVKKDGAEKEKKSAAKNGFLNKLGLILFGEDDEEDEEIAKVTLEKAPEKPKKEKKKREKVKKEKVKKEKPPKPKKEKKPKPPKEPDNTPPLPKKPVFLMFLMVGSFIALVILGADLLGYANQMENAKNQYAKKNYSEAYAEISGMEIKEEDLTLYGKYRVMAMVSAELEAYESLMSHEFYEMALDCLVRTIGRAEKYRADAEAYGCIKELNELEAKAEEILKATFDVSKEQALEFYSYRSKREYSVAIANVIKGLELEKVVE